MHEIGHALGLDHPCENCTVDAVMTPSYVGYPFRYLRQDDTDGICGVYPGQRGGLGWGCTPGNYNSRLCITDRNSRYCSQTCGNCPTGYECRQSGGQNVCLRADALADAAGRGEACVGRPLWRVSCALVMRTMARCYQTCNGDAPCPRGPPARTFDGQNIISGSRARCVSTAATRRGEACDSCCRRGARMCADRARWTCARTCLRDGDCGADQECAQVARPGVDTIRVCLDRRFARLGESCEDKPCEGGPAASTTARVLWKRSGARRLQRWPRVSAGARRRRAWHAPYVGASCVDDLDCPAGQICRPMNARRSSHKNPKGGRTRCAEDAHCQTVRAATLMGSGAAVEDATTALGHYRRLVKSCVVDQMSNIVLLRTATRGPTRSVSRVVKLVSACTASARTGAAPPGAVETVGALRIIYVMARWASPACVVTSQALVAVSRPGWVAPAARRRASGSSGSFCCVGYVAAGSS